MTRICLLVTISLLLSLLSYSQNLIDNGDFEDEPNTAWEFSGPSWYINYYQLCEFTGSPYFYAYVGNSDGTGANNTYGSMYQEIFIPANAIAIELNYKISINTSETSSSALDVLEVQFRETDASLIETIYDFNNTDGDYPQNGLCQVAIEKTHDVFDELSEYLGQTVRLNFQVAGNNTNITRIRIDDVSILVEQSDCTAPSTPNGLSVDAVTSSSIDLDWSSVSGSDYYQIYTCGGDLVDDYVSSSSYTVPGLNDCQSYTYKVRACKDCGECSSFTSCITGNTECCDAPEAPTALNTSAPTQTTINLSWSSVANSESYNVYYGSSSCSSLSFYGNYSGTNATITGLVCGTTYYFKVIASNECGDSSYSSCDNETTLDCTICDPVTISNEPDNISVNVGSDANFYCGFSGTGPFQYTWYNFLNAPMGAAQETTSNTCSLTIDNVTEIMDGQFFYCVVSNCAGDFEATSNSGTLNVNEMSEQVFELNTDGVSHLFWPFGNSNWNEDINHVERAGWISVEELYDCEGPNEPCSIYHDGGDYFAQDWNKWQDESWVSCGEPFYSPLQGVVIVADYSCWADACNADFCSGYENDANNVFIQSSDNPNFIFGVLHLKNDFAELEPGSEVAVGQQIGVIGGTGEGNAHAHCVLWKNVQQPSPNLPENLSPLGIFINPNYYGTNATNSLNPGTNGASLFLTYRAKFIFDAIIDSPNTGGASGLPIIIEEGTSEICPGETITLTAPDALAYEWSTGQFTQSILVNEPGIYHVTMTLDVEGTTTFQTITVTQISDLPITVLSESSYLCVGSTVNLWSSNIPTANDFNYSSDTFNQYLWSTGETTNMISVSEPGEYGLQFEYGGGCFSFTDTVTIQSAEVPEQPVIIVGGNGQLASTSVGSSYQWYFDNITNPINGAIGNSIDSDTCGGTGFYWVEAFNEFGCSSLSDPVYMVGVDESEYLKNGLRVFPNPNNGTFSLEVKTGKIEPIRLEVINTQGQIVLSRNFISGSSMQKCNVDLTNEVAGIYLLKISTSMGNASYKILVMK